MRARTIIFAAFTGLAVTVATAWGFQWQLGTWRVSVPRRLSTVDAPSWKGSPPEGYAHPAVSEISGSSIGVTFSQVSSEPALPRMSESLMIQRVAAFGFPLPALRTQIWYDGHRKSKSWHQGIWYGDATEGDDLFRRSALPLVPCWPGLLVDSVLYASVALAWPAFKDVRRWSRRRHGLCTACAYPLGHAGATCPECGVLARNANHRSD